MSKGEKAREVAAADLNIQWLGACRACSKAGAGQCPSVNRRAEEAGLEPEDVQAAIRAQLPSADNDEL